MKNEKFCMTQIDDYYDKSGTGVHYKSRRNIMFAIHLYDTLRFIQSMPQILRMDHSQIFIVNLYQQK